MKSKVPQSLYPRRELRNVHLADAQRRLWVGTTTRWHYIPNWVSKFAHRIYDRCSCAICSTAGGHMIIVEVRLTSRQSILDLDLCCVCRTRVISNSSLRPLGEPCKATAIHSYLKTRMVRASFAWFRLQIGPCMIWLSLIVSRNFFSCFFYVDDLVCSPSLLHRGGQLQ
jgi:hypothetical protein